MRLSSFDPSPLGSLGGARRSGRPDAASWTCRLLPLLAIVATGCHAPAPSTRASAPGPDTLRVLAYNIHHGEGRDGVLDLERIAAVVRRLDPDLVALQEVDRGVERTERVDQASVLGELTGLEPFFGAFMPYQGGEYGMALLSRWPVIERRNHRLPEGTEPRSAAAIRVRSPTTGREIVFAGVHLYRTEEERLAQARALVESLGEGGDPTILAGDFNSEPGSPVLDLLATEWEILPKGDDRLTFPSHAPSREIDFLMVRSTGRFDVLDQRTLAEPVASDHRPVFAVLVLR